MREMRLYLRDPLLIHMYRLVRIIRAPTEAQNEGEHMHLTLLDPGFRSVEHTDTLNDSPAHTDEDGGN